jgi:hypothetical protein
MGYEDIIIESNYNSVPLIDIDSQNIIELDYNDVLRININERNTVVI